MLGQAETSAETHGLVKSLMPRRTTTTSPPIKLRQQFLSSASSRKGKILSRMQPYGNGLVQRTEEFETHLWQLSWDGARNLVVTQH